MGSSRRERERGRFRKGDRGKATGNVSIAEASAAFRHMRQSNSEDKHDLCFKCGLKGHIARHCTKNAANSIAQAQDQINFLHGFPCAESRPESSLGFLFMARSESSERSKTSEAPSEISGPRRTASSKKAPSKKKSSSSESTDEKLLKARERSLERQEKRVQRLKRAREVAESRAELDKEIDLIEKAACKIERERELEILKTERRQHDSERGRKRRKKEKSKSPGRSKDRPRRRGRSEERFRRRKRSTPGRNGSSEELPTPEVKKEKLRRQTDASSRLLHEGPELLREVR